MSITLEEYANSLDCDIITYYAGTTYLKVRKKNYTSFYNSKSSYEVDKALRIMFVTTHPNNHTIDEIRLFTPDGKYLVLVLTNVSIVKFYNNAWMV